MTEGSDGGKVVFLRDTKAMQAQAGRVVSADETRLDELRAQGIVIEPPAEFDALPLKEPGYGDTVLGEMNDVEASLFATLHRLSGECEQKNREITGAVFQDVGSRISAGEVKMENGMLAIEPGMGVPQQAGETFFRLLAQRDVIRSTLWWSWGERFGSHHFTMGARRGRRVVKIQQKF